MSTQNKKTADKSATAPEVKAAPATMPAPVPALIPAPEVVTPAPPILGEPAFSVFRDWVATSAPNIGLIALTAEVSAAEQEAARLLKRISEAKEQRRQAALDADADDAAALAHARLVAEVEALPVRISRAEANRIDANLRYLAALRQYAKEVVLETQKAQKPLLDKQKEAGKQIGVSDGRFAYEPTLTDAERESEIGKLNEVGKQLGPLLQKERLADEVCQVAAVRAEPYGRNILRDYADRLILFSDFGRGVAVEAAREAAYSRALALVKR